MESFRNQHNAVDDLIEVLNDLTMQILDNFV